MNFEQARFNMVEQQIRTCQVLSEDALDLLYIVKREDFVPPAYRALALAQTEIPLGHGASMLMPQHEAYALHHLHVRQSEKVLEIGTGSGYMAALLAVHAAHVWSVEIEPALAEMARDNLQRQGANNVSVVTGNGAGGWIAQAPYDVIMVSGALPVLPQALLAQLKIGGRLFAFVGAAPVMEAVFVTRTGESTYESKALFETQVPALRDAPQPARFSF